MDPVPLSEEEQRILHEIERSLYENDPEFARGVSTATLKGHAGRNTRWSAAGFVAGLLLLLYSLDQLFWLSALAFLLMLGSAFVFASNVRRLTRGSFSLPRQFGAGRLGSVFSEPGKRLRSRFKRDE